MNDIKWWELLNKEDIPEDCRSHSDQLAILKKECDAMLDGMEGVWKQGIQDEQQFKDKKNLTDLGFQEYRGRVSYNLAKYCVSALFNKIGTKAPKATFVTKDKGYKDQKVAIKLDKWMLDVFKKCDVKEEALQAVLSCLVKGWGVVKIYKKKGKVKVRYVTNECFYVDDIESLSKYRDQMGDICRAPAGPLQISRWVIGRLCLYISFLRKLKEMRF